MKSVMDRACQDECFRLIKKYKGLSREHYKAECRNEIYSLLREHLIIWIKSTLGRWKRFVEDCEVMAYSWDAFLFCLDNYDPFNYTTHIPFFFNRYTNYWLLMHFAKKDEGIKIPLEDLEDTLKTIHSPENLAFGKLIRLYHYREAIPENVRGVWDDAFLSISYKNSCKQNYKSKSELPAKVYYTLKESFKGIITHVLKE